MIILRTMGIAAIATVLWLAGNSSAFVTVRQGDTRRSARTLRTADISADGRYVAFESWARLVPADDNDGIDVYVLDRATGRVTLETNGRVAECSHPRISGDGRYVVFEARFSGASGEPRIQIILRDRSSSTDRVLTTAGNASTHTGWSRNPDISDDGRVVVFSSAATALVDGPDANGPLEDVYAIDLSTGTTTRISVTTTGAQLPKGTSILPAVSADGRWVAFASTSPLEATGRAVNDESPIRHVYLRDRSSGTTLRVSRSPRGAPLDGDSTLPALSGDGRFVAYASDATNLADNDGNRASDLFLFDREKEDTILVSRAANGAVAGGMSTNPSLSSNGRFVAFQSDAANLVCAGRCAATEQDVNLLWDTFVFDRLTLKTTRMSEDELGGWMDWSAGIAIDGSGSVVAFSSRHPRDGSDRFDDVDLFVRSLTPPSLMSR